MSAYYNEIDPFAAAWLRELIKGGHIADGEVDERSIADVRGADLRGFVQCHFFAGIGGWSYALRLAGWPDDRPVWTGSCPCQPFSAAGKGDGAADSRHLWPTWFRLVAECRPAIVFGEQVASVDGLAWFDRVSTDLEGADYAIGAADLCAAGVGAPHIRQRLYWVADAERGSAERHGLEVGGAARGAEGAAQAQERERLRDDPRDGREFGGLADARSLRGGGGDAPESYCDGAKDGIPRRDGAVGRVGDAYDTRSQGWGVLSECAGERASRTASVGRGLADAISDECGQERAERAGSGSGSGAEGLEQRLMHLSAWRDCDWLPCRDGKWRPVESGTFPLAHGVSGRVGRLRGYGNAIVPFVAARFIQAAEEAIQGAA